MTDLLLGATCLMFMCVGLLSPFVWSLGYVWVDTLLPQRLSYGLLTTVPIAFIMGAGAVLAYLVRDRKYRPPVTLIHILVVCMGAWITITTTWAIMPASAWIKWDVSFKTVLFCAFMPFVFRSRVQIEAFLLVFMFAAAGHLLPWGLKTLASGGGYELSLGLLGVNTTMLAESSTVAAVVIMFIPLLAWMRNHSLLIPWRPVRTYLLIGMSILYIIANIGTFARTGLLALGVFGVAMLLRTKRKILWIFMAAVLAGVAFYFTSDRWTARISTTFDYQGEGSAMIRLAVWQWTIGFVQTHPWGGGFNAFLINQLVIGTTPDGEPIMAYGRAFHNIYMAALGEHGYLGFVLYVSILSLTLWNLQGVIRQAKARADLVWASDLARAAQVGLLVLMTGGNFVDFSFNFLVWNMIALGMCLRNHVTQVVRMETPAPVLKGVRRADPVPAPAMARQSGTALPTG